MKLLPYLILIFAITSNNCYGQSYKGEHDIVLVNIGRNEKSKIAKVIATVCKFGPKVISIDAAFRNQGFQGDSDLFEVLNNLNNAVFPLTMRSIGKDSQGNDIELMVSECSEFTPLVAKEGFVSAEMNRGRNRIPKRFSTWIELSYGKYYHFSVKTVMQFDSLKATNFITKNPSVIDFKYDPNRKFRTFTFSEVLDGKIGAREIQGKIVMFGYLGPGDEDRFIAPSDEGSIKTIYGLEYLASIVAQILEY